MADRFRGAACTLSVAGVCWCLKLYASHPERNTQHGCDNFDTQ